MQSFLYKKIQGRNYNTLHQRDITCGICFEINIDSKQCKICKNIFCTQCIQHWLQEQGIQYQQTEYCPFKCSNPMVLQKLSRLTQKLLSDSKKTCPYDWCLKEIKLENIVDHLKGCLRRANQKKQLIEKQNQTPIIPNRCTIPQEKAYLENFYSRNTFDFKKEQSIIVNDGDLSINAEVSQDNPLSSQNKYQKVKNIILSLEQKKKKLEQLIEDEESWYCTPEQQTFKTAETYQYNKQETLSQKQNKKKLQQTPEKFLQEQIFRSPALAYGTSFQRQLQQLNKELSYLKQYYFILKRKNQISPQQIIIKKTIRPQTVDYCEEAIRNGLYCSKHHHKRSMLQ